MLTSWEKWRKVKKNAEKWRKVKKKMKKSEEKWLQNKDFYRYAFWDAWYTHTHTHRWHMERNLGFVATFLHFSPQYWKVEKKEEKRRKVKKNEEKWLQNKDFYRYAFWDAWYTHTHTQMAQGKKSWFCSHFSPCYGVTLMRACARVGGYRNMRPETLEIR